MVLFWCVVLVRHHMASSTQRCWLQIRIMWFVDQMVSDSVHHYHTCNVRPLLKWLPLEFLQHRCNTASPLVVSSCASCSSPLHCFHFSDIFLFAGLKTVDAYLSDGRTSVE